MKMTIVATSTCVCVVGNDPTGSINAFKTNNRGGPVIITMVMIPPCKRRAHVSERGLRDGVADDAGAASGGARHAGGVRAGGGLVPG